MTPIDVEFPAGDGTCGAWLFTAPPSGSDPRPVIVLAHGLGGVREMRLDAFARRFNQAGYHCLVFDYRHFGSSSGEPRQLLDIDRQLEDWAAAVAFARTLSGVDPARVVLWGTSFGGGHVLRTAAHDPRVAAVISQCPFTDGLASSLALPLRTSVKLLALAVRDRLRSLRGRTPLMVPTYGPPGSTALMTSPDTVRGIEAMIPSGLDLRSDVAARFSLDIIRYYPGRDARNIACPIHFAVCRDDSVAPTRATLRHVARAPLGEVRIQPGGHFDIYVGEDFERNIAQQLAFLDRHVPVTA